MYIKGIWSDTRCYTCFPAAAIRRSVANARKFTIAKEIATANIRDLSLEIMLRYCLVYAVT